MATGDQFVSISPKRLLGFLDFRDRWLNYFKKIFEDITENAFAQNGFFNAAVTMSAFGPDKIQIDNDIVGTDAQGHFILTNEALAGRAPSASGIRVENTLGVTYSVALIYAERPSGIQINPRTGFPEFLRIDEHIGVRDEADLVTDHGDGTMTFRVNSVGRPFAADVSNALDQSGRKVLVWKKTPGRTAVTEGAAILEGTIALVGGNNEITVGTVGVDPFGQTPGDASTNTSDYFVLLEGPTVSRQDLSVEPFTLFIGTFDGTGAGSNPGSFSISGQNTLSSVASDLGQVTAPHHGNLKLRTRADAADIDESQIEVQDAGAVPRFTVDEDGDTNISGTLDVQGLATLLNALISSLTISGDLSVAGETGLGGAVVPGKKLKTHGNTEIGSDELDAHTLFGDLTLQDDALTPNVVIDGQFGAVNIRQATGTGSLKNGSDSRLQGVTTLGENANGGTAFLASRFPRIDFGDLNALSLLNQLLQWTGFSGEFTSPTTRVFGHRNGEGAWITINANYDGDTSVFFKDQANDIAIGIELVGANGTQGSLRVYTHNPASTGSWGTFAWDNTLLHWDLDSNLLTGSFPDLDGTLNIDGQIVLGTGGDLLLLQGTSGIGTIFALGGSAASDWENTCPLAPIIADGNLESTSGQVIADQGVLATNGPVSAQNGAVSASGAVSAGTTMSCAGNITSSAGNIQATLGDILAPLGDVEAGGHVQATTEFRYAAEKTFYKWAHGNQGMLDQLGGASRGSTSGFGARDQGGSPAGPPSFTGPIGAIMRLDDDAGGIPEASWDIHLPDGVVLDSIDLLYETDAPAGTYAIMRVDKISNTGVFTQLRSSTLSVPQKTGIGFINYNSDPFLSEIIDNQNFRYMANIIYFNSVNKIDIHGIRFRYRMQTLSF